MDTINWFQIRGLGFLALVGFLFIYAVLVASLQKWRVKRTPRVPTPDTPLDVQSVAGGAVGTAANPRDWRDERLIADAMRRAA